MSGREQLGPYCLAWPDGVFPLGQDCLELGRFATVRRGWRVCDLGTGSGALLLMLAAREESLSLAGVDRDPAAVKTAEHNLHENGLEGTVLQADWRDRELPAGQYDLVVSNPPYFAPGTGASGGASRMGDGTAEELCAAAARLLKHGGRFALLWRPERLCELICALRGAGIEPKRLQLLCHSAHRPPYAVMVEGARQGRPGLEILPLLGEKG